MARWKRALPDEHDPAVVQFVVQMRRMKDDSGLTLQQLADRTGYSKSSWERYLGGRHLPPAQAVEALAEVVGTDPVRLLARHARAVDAWQDPRPDRTARPEPQGEADAAHPEPAAVAGAEAQQPAEPEAEPPAGPVSEPVSEPLPGPVPGPVAGATSRRYYQQPLWSVLTALVGAVGGAGIALLIAMPGQSAPAPQPVAVNRAPLYSCDYTRRAGLWYAGNGDSSTAPLQVDDTGPQVAEFQCLLQRAGFSPGGIDGSFGPETLAALIAFQKARLLDVDGQVGPHTWAALRG
jgi:transcriptional regulator with XRE-family HTH domain